MDCALGVLGPGSFASAGRGFLPALQQQHFMPHLKLLLLDLK